MRLSQFVFFAVSVLASVPAMAGTVTASGGQVNWQSTQCTPPASPAPVVVPSRHHAPPNEAEDVNRRVTAYNDYTSKVQAYMDCISNEAQADAKSISDAIAASAQHTIDDARSHAADMAGNLQKK